MEQSLEEFTAALASAQSAPGGGAAAAVVGALSVSLGAMSANYGCKKGDDAVLAAIAEQAQAMRGDFLNLADCDSETYRAYSMLRERAKEDPSCTAALEAGEMAVTHPPMMTMRFACRSIALLERLAPRSGKALGADVAAAAALSRAALSAAAAMLRANTAQMKDKTAAQLLLQEAQMRLEEYLPRADALYRGLWETMSDGETNDK